jgi:predicted alpha/beta hydrolase family esterase
MKQIILIHGSPEPGEEMVTQESITPDWFRWLKETLPNVIIPPFPLETEVVYQNWSRIMDQVPVSADTILVGHSCGGGFLFRYLSEHPELKPARAIFVAAWLDPHHELSTDFMKFEIDPGLSERTDVHVFISMDDAPSLVDSYKIIKERLRGVHYYEFTDREHFCGKREFPELLDLLK